MADPALNQAVLAYTRARLNKAGHHAINGHDG